MLPFFFFFSYTFASGSPDNIKQWKFPDGNFIQNLSGHNAIINTLAVNSDGVLVSGGKNETFVFIFHLSTPPYELSSSSLSFPLSGPISLLQCVISFRGE